MPIDAERALALEIPPITVDVERGRLRFFAKAIGQTDPVYTDIAAARAAGHPDLPVPPTFFFSLELEAPDPFAFLAALDIDLRHVLHGEQSFEYLAPVYAGDRVTLTPSFVDVSSKKGGALELLTKETVITRDSITVARATNVIVVRNPGAAS